MCNRVLFVGRGRFVDIKIRKNLRLVYFVLFYFYGTLRRGDININYICSHQSDGILQYSGIQFSSCSCQGSIQTFTLDSPFSCKIYNFVVTDRPTLGTDKSNSYSNHGRSICPGARSIKLPTLGQPGLLRCFQPDNGRRSRSLALVSTRYACCSRSHRLSHPVCVFESV